MVVRHVTKKQGKHQHLVGKKFMEILLVIFWDERLHCVCTEVSGLVHACKFYGESVIAVSPTVGDDGLDDELMFVVLSH